MTVRRLLGASGVVALIWAGPAWGLSQDEEAPASVEPQAAPDAEDDTGEQLREVVLSLRGGREVSAVLVRQTESAVVVLIEGIETTFEKRDLTGLRELPPLLERYRTMRALLDESNLDGRVLLAEWLRSREQYELAMEEVGGVLARDPHHPRALDLKTWLELQLTLEASKRAGSNDPAGVGPDAKEAFLARQRARLGFPLLKPEQINLIKVYEVDLRNPPMLLVKRETIDQLIRMNPESPLIPATPEGREALYRKPPEQILELMFRLQARELYDQVLVRGHPAAIERFRNDVHGKWLINSCATAQCHGGGQAGRLWLYDRRPYSDETVYTNLLILEKFRLSDGTPLVNYAEPARSPLLQMGLPEELSLYPHPSFGRTRGARAWRPVFRTADDRRFQDAVGWIGGMYRPRPAYPIEYEPPSPSTEQRVGSEDDPER